MYKKKILFVFFAVMLFSIITPAFAYEVLGYRWKNNTVIWYYDNYISWQAKNALASGASSWNEANADASLKFTAASYNVYCSDVEQTEVEWDGMTNGYGDSNTGYFVSLTLYLNSASKAWDSAKALGSVAGHEFGHVFGLGENGHTMTLMNAYTWGYNSRYETYSITKPTNDDIRGVNDLY
ncbi:MAG: matrixin family metalloprotease [Oscillospiraceae bacterium]|nr:matrixin family metalloprotease [Oscillospiraceae bacterium]